MSRSLLPALRGFARARRGSVSIELALGAVALVSVSALCFDLYARIKADTAGARMAMTMADYVSRDAAPDGAQMTALGAFLHAHELGVPADLVYVITAIRQPVRELSSDPLPAVKLLWSDDSIRIGDPATTKALASSCARHVTADASPKLPDDFTPMSVGEVLVIAEVCARLTREGSLTGRFITGDIYRLHALPARDPNQPPAEPSYAETETTAALSTGRLGGIGTAVEPAEPPALLAASA